MLTVTPRVAFVKIRRFFVCVRFCGILCTIVDTFVEMQFSLCLILWCITYNSRYFPRNTPFLCFCSNRWYIMYNRRYFRRNTLFLCFRLILWYVMWFCRYFVYFRLILWYVVCSCRGIRRYTLILCL